MSIASPKNPKHTLEKDDNLYIVRFHLQATYGIGWSGSPSDFLSDFTAELTYYDHSGDDLELDEDYPPDPPGVTSDPNEPELKIIGRLDGFLLPFGKHFNASNKPHIFEILDSHSQDVHDFYNAFFQGNDLKPRFYDAAELFPNNVLLLTMMKIAPSFRGKGLGLELLKAVTDAPFLPSGTYIGLKPCPVSDNEDEELDEEAQRIGTKKLFAYWKKAGYDRIPRTEYLCSQFVV
jgi:GNAT superfamily N-acetyltransferase